MLIGNVDGAIYRAGDLRGQVRAYVGDIEAWIVYFVGMKWHFSVLPLYFRNNAVIGVCKTAFMKVGLLQLSRKPNACRKRLNLFILNPYTLK